MAYDLKALVAIGGRLLTFACLAAPAAAHLPNNLPPAGLIMNQTDALKSTFAAGFARRTVFLEPDQAKRAEALCEAKLRSSMAVVYDEASEGGRRALFERVPAGHGSVTLMIVANADRSLAATRILASDLPAAFLPPAGWLARLEGRRVSEVSWTAQGLSRDPDALSAAEAVLGAVRRGLAVFEAIAEK